MSIKTNNHEFLYLLNHYVIIMWSALAVLFYSHLSYAHDNVTNIKPEKHHKDIRVVMSAAFVSESGIDVYSKIFKYLGNKIHHKFVFVSGFSYETIDAMLDSGMADVGFVCGLPYVLKHDGKHPSVDLIAAPVMKDKKYNDKPEYFSYIIVNKNSKVNRFLELRNKVFAYNDEISNSGYNMPRDYMIKLGLTNGFFTKTLRTGSHEESIRLVAKGEVDVSAVDSLVYDYDLVNHPVYVRNTKIIKILGPAGIPPVVVSTKFSLSHRREIKDALISMHNDPEGRKILDKAMVDRFVDVADSNYDGIRRMKNEAKKKGYLKIK